MATLLMRHAETGGESRFQDEPGVREFYEARGWTVVDEPEPVPFVPTPGNSPAGDDGFVEMYHPAVGATHRFPNNQEAIAGAEESGWTLPHEDREEIASTEGSDPADDTETPEPEPAPRTRKSRASASADSEKENS